MIFRLLVVVCFFGLATVPVAQVSAETTATETADNASTTTLTADEPSTSTTSTTSETTSPQTAALPPPPGKMVTQEEFNRRWAKMEKLYQDGGVPAEKISQVRELEWKVQNALQRGERIDFAAIRREKAQLLNEDEQKKVDEQRRKLSERRRREAGESDSATSGSEQQ